MFWSQVNSLQMQPSPVNKWYNATQNWRKNKSTTLFADQIHTHDDVIKWKHFPRYWPFVREIHRSPVNFPHKGQWRGALMFALIYVWIIGWVNNREAGDLRRNHTHYDVMVMIWLHSILYYWVPQDIDHLWRYAFKSMMWNEIHIHHKIQ